ncbi:MAG: phosphoribosyltransferase family protein [Acidimicrobiales bacterium]
MSRTVPPAPRVEFRYSSVADGLDPDELFGVARRINPRRSALFVSRVLGKHIPVDPAACYAAGLRLAAPGPAHVIGFAETATALGHIVHDGLPGSDYVHSTRKVEAHWAPVLTFSEDHSHAVDHRLFHRDPSWLDDGQPALFVDDELTTGRTILNLIAEIQSQWPRHEYRVAAFLDWRDRAARAAFEEAAARLGTTITVTSLVAGEATSDDTPALVVENGHPKTAPVPVVTHDIDLGTATARYGWGAADQAELESKVVDVAGKLAASRTGPRALVLGTEEFMYAPLRVAMAMGEGVLYQSTTRSPVVAADVDGYPIRHKAAFVNPAEPRLASYVYNVAPDAYDDIFVVFEGPPLDVRPLVASLSGTRPNAIHLVVNRP